MFEKRKQELIQRQLLSAGEKDLLFAGLLRIPTLFLSAKGLLKPEDIDFVSDAVYLCLWRAALNVATQNEGQLPEDPYAAGCQLEAESRKLALADPATFHDEHHLYLFGNPEVPGSGLLNFIFAPENAPLSEPVAAQLLKKYLEEVIIVTQMRQFADRYRNTIPADMSSILDQINDQKTKIAGVGTQVGATLSSVLKGRPETEIFTTGLPFMDKFMNGGQSPGEVYVILGTTGAGKSSLAVQLAMEGVVTELDPDRRGTKKYWYYFCYEQPEQDVVNRALSYVARIDTQSLLNISRLSSSKLQNYKPYEMELFDDAFRNGINPPGELERMEAAIQSTAEHLIVADFSGEHKGVGIGGVDEIIAYLDRASMEGRPPAGIVIDYAGVCASRYIFSRNLDPKAMYPVIGCFVDNIRTRVGSRFKCCCWILHQLSGGMAGRSPTSSLHHSMAQGSRNFADNAWFAFEIGTQEIGTGLVKIECSKHRRSSPMPPAMVKFDGAICRMTATEADYTTDPVSNRFISSKEKHSFINPSDLPNLSSFPSSFKFFN